MFYDLNQLFSKMFVKSFDRICQNSFQHVERTGLSNAFSNYSCTSFFVWLSAVTLSTNSKTCGCQSCNSLVQMKNLFKLFAFKNIFLYMHQDFDQKVIDIPASNSGKGCQKCNSIFWEKFLIVMFPIRLFASNLFLLWLKLIWSFDEGYPAVLSNWASWCPEELIEEKVVWMLFLP